MSFSLKSALDRIRLHSESEFEKGAYFERLVKVFLENDAQQAQHFDRVWLYKDWAEETGQPITDIGIDLVAQHADGSGLCAIQCKFYAENHAITKADIDSFIAAASMPDFCSVVLVDTTLKDLSTNALTVLDKIDKTFWRIPLAEMEKSQIVWSAYFHDQTVTFKEPKTLRDHQREALEAVRTAFATEDRGKLIMACGTGKTFTGLKISEELAGKGKIVLYMVPSLALMSQTVREWKNDSREDFLAFSVCSDVKVGKRQSDSDIIQFTTHDLAFPATTDAAKIARQVQDADRDQMIVVFSTYQSIQTITKAQQTHGLPEFDLIICDEAHRTTGATIAGEDESNFVRIHSNDHVNGKKRLYMTATPKIFGENAKSKAKQHDVTLADMGDEATYGKTIYQKGFGWAVENNLLSDYKVVVLAVDEGLISTGVQNRLAQSSEMKLDDATKLIGFYKALTKQNLIGEEVEHPKPMQRALAFCKSINNSKMVTGELAEVVDEYLNHPDINDNHGPALGIETRHVDGTFNAKEREACLDWLKDDEAGDDVCRILTNARCLSEGVDVPSLDAIIFMHPRKSVIDVVQSVGRVMRKAPGKDMGYVILPVAIPAGVAPEDALNDNERYQVVWQILNALRAHDERFDSTINQISLGEDVEDKIQIIGVTQELMATTAVVEDIDVNKTKRTGTDVGGNSGDRGDDEVVIDMGEPTQGAFVFDELTQAIRAKIVEKCGTREYWENWAKDIAKIAEAHITRIRTITGQDGPERDAFMAFLTEIRDDLNPEISEQDAIEMLAQHLITKPVFDTLFKDNEFTSNNPVSRAMETVLGQLDQHNLGKEAESLQSFYASVQRRAADIKSAQGRQSLVTELYDKFFRTAFPALTQKLGIVYTPVEVVDFIIHSVNDVLQSEFGQTLGSEGVHILDPFTGTGTFITRLLQSGLIAPHELEHKYKTEIHANEIVLLAYYIAAINIEAVYHDLAQEAGMPVPYTPFDGIVLTDTFQLYEQDHDMVADLLPDNSERRTRQKQLDIRVIMGNPPYSAGQSSANDNAANVEYANLDGAIRDSYAAYSTQQSIKNLYDSYIRAFKWASDRIGDAGVMAFVSGGAWIERSFADGMRKCLGEEFSDLYVFHLRGDIRKNMLSKGMAAEGGNVFGSGSMTGIAISVFVKNPDASEHGRIHFHDIGDELDQKQKLGIIKHFKSIGGITAKDGWRNITPDDNNDWLDQVDKSFERHIQIGSKEKGNQDAVVFANYSLGLASGRDSWAYNFSKASLNKNVSSSIDYYNAEVERLAGEPKNKKTKLIIIDETKFSWNRNAYNDLEKEKLYSFKSEKLQGDLYRPFTKHWVYFDAQYNAMTYKLKNFYPNADSENLVIQVSGVGARAGFSALMSNKPPCLDNVEKGQCFPLYLYEDTNADDGLFGAQDGGLTRRDAITDDGLAHFQSAYAGEDITKKDLFYYIYGLLHSPEYRTRFKNNLAKALPRIPPVKTFADFAAFRDAGHALGDLHVNFETVDRYPIVIAEGDLRLAQIDDPKSFYRVEKMKYGGKGKDKDKTTVHYNPQITMTEIPLRAYEYVVNGKPALDWVMERQCVKTDKASGIVNDANDYANETMNNPAYPLELFQRVITVSLETLDIVAALPALDIE